METRLCDRCGERLAEHELIVDGRRRACSCSQCWYLVCEEYATGQLLLVGRATPDYVERFDVRRRC